MRTAGSDEFDWQLVYSLPFDDPAGMGTAEVNLLRQFAGQWLQFRFDGFVPPASSAGVPSWTIDDIEIAGIANFPFAAILPQGSGPGQ